MKAISTPIGDVVVLGPKGSEHPCAGPCLGCGAGPDESCYGDCGCDLGQDCYPARLILDPPAPGDTVDVEVPGTVTFGGPSQGAGRGTVTVPRTVTKVLRIVTEPDFNPPCVFMLRTGLGDSIEIWLSGGQPPVGVDLPDAQPGGVVVVLGETS